MSNFDFDELDKAVADALGSNASSVSFNDTASDLVNDAPAVASNETQEMPSTPEVAVHKPVAPPAIRRSSGRFMDVVHPSSDMRTSSPSRGRFTPPVIAPVAETSEEVDTTDSSSDFENISDLGWTKPADSPFLPDARVEKRPLGAEVPTGPATQEPQEEALLLEAPDDPQLEATAMPDPIDFAAQRSALALEVEDTGTSEEISEDVAPEAPNPPEADEIVEAPTVATLAVEDIPIEPAGPASITQQYEEQPSSQQESGAIYDTENYHQPVAEGAKKSHGAWTIIWIFLLILLGAAAGVAFYFFVLPML